MNSTLLLTLLLVAVAAAHSFPTEKIDVEEEWTMFKKTYGRVFANHKLEMSRKAIFEKNLRDIHRHNLLYKRGIKSHTLAVTKFSDMTNKEFKELMGSLRMPANYKKSGSTYLSPMNIGPLPEKVDWRNEGLVSPVKDQLNCGSCWAFSTVGSIEGQQAKKTGKMVLLSEQDLVDCSRSNGGCHGGLMDNAFKDIIESKGIDTAKSYPYEGVDDQGCRFKNETIGATLSGYVDIESGNEEQLKEALATIGPISVAIDASDPNFSYLGGEGIYQYADCTTDHLDHAVLLVGYGTENGQDYWLIKNSYGENWGLHGYLKMARNKGNMCGIATAASYPVV